MRRLVICVAMIGLFAVSLGVAQAKTSKSSPLKVGMVTDGGTIDDLAYNQSTWEGLQRAKKELGSDVKYLKPTGVSEDQYVAEIGKLYRAGYRVIVTAGFQFETSIFSVQDKYKDAQFVIVDGSPNNGAYDDTRAESVGRNTVSIFFNEGQAGFLAGVASAVEVKKGAFGFIGGMEIPPVQHYGWGFQQGVQYANDNYGTQITMNPENIVYQGTFSDVSAGQALASKQYDRGVKLIFAVAGGVGVGVINEAKARAKEGAMVVGVDVDQFRQGEYEAGKSVILTSAIKRIDVAVFEMVKAESAGRFPGGQTLVFDVNTDGVGIPRLNPNLGPGAIKATSEALSRLRSGEIQLASGNDFKRVKSSFNVDMLLADLVPPMEGFETDEEYQARLEEFRTSAEYQSALENLTNRVFEVATENWDVDIGDFDRKAKEWVIEVRVTDPGFNFEGKVRYSLAGDPEIKNKFDTMSQAIEDGNLAGAITYEIRKTEAGAYEPFGGVLKISELATGSEIVTLELE